MDDVRRNVGMLFKQQQIPQKFKSHISYFDAIRFTKIYNERN